MLKKCSHCKNKLDITFFRLNKDKTRQDICKTCQKILLDNGYRFCTCCNQILPLTNEYFYNNKYRKSGLDSICKTCTSNRVSNWQKENKERTHERVKRYIRSEKGKITNSSKSMKYEAKKRGLACTLTNNEWNNIKTEFSNCCAYCGKPKKLEREHIVPLTKNGEYTIKNIIPACKSCNSSKGNKDFLTWYRVQPFYSLDRENKIRERI